MVGVGSPIPYVLPATATASLALSCWLTALR